MHYKQSDFRLVQHARKLTAAHYNTQRRLRRVICQNRELVELTEDMSRELADVQQAVSKEPTHEGSYRELLATTDSECGSDFANRVRVAWETDLARNRNGSHGNRWHPLTLRIALAIYSRSPQAYAAWKQFEFFKLPSKRTLQRYMNDEFKSNPGICMEKFALDVDHYWKKQEGKRYPGLGEGCLILDEVKIIAKMSCNLKDNTILGLCLSSSELSSLR